MSLVHLYLLRNKVRVESQGSVRLLHASIRQGALSLRCFNHRLLPLRWNTTEWAPWGEPGEGLQKHSHQSPHPPPNGSPPAPCAFNLLLPAPLSVHNALCAGMGGRGSGEQQVRLHYFIMCGGAQARGGLAVHPCLVIVWA